MARMETASRRPQAAGAAAPWGADAWIVTVHIPRLVEAVAHLRREVDAVCSSKPQPELTPELPAACGRCRWPADAPPHWRALNKPHLNTAAPFCPPKSVRLRSSIPGCSGRCDEAACRRAGQGVGLWGWRWRQRGGGEWYQPNPCCTEALFGLRYFDDRVQPANHHTDSTHCAARAAGATRASSRMPISRAMAAVSEKFMWDMQVGIKARRPRRRGVLVGDAAPALLATHPG